MRNPIIRFFDYQHLSGDLREVSRYHHDLARQMDSMLPECAEKSAGLRKLLEAKDCAVRAMLPNPVESDTEGATTTPK